MKTHDPCLKKLDEAQQAFAMGWTAAGLRLLGEVKELYSVHNIGARVEIGPDEIVRSGDK